jgi:ABC-type branched-subunit amino acid transport system ATPase component
MSATGELLEARDVQVHFAGVKAVDGVDLALRRGEILGLIGPNGAGKTTLVNALSCFQRPTSGRVLLGDADVTGWDPSRLGSQGLARTFQNVRLFGRLTVFENVELGALGGGLRTAEARELTWSLLERVNLAERARMRADSLPYGEERRVGILRALAMRPRFLLLDEPAAGLNEAESDELMETLGRLPGEFGLGLLIIEHDMRLIMRLCERIQVIDHGKTIAVGTPSEIRKDPVVLTAYLGTGRTSEDAAS